MLKIANSYHQTSGQKQQPTHDGFWWPMDEMVIPGWQEWKATGRYPNPYELARRIVPSFKEDIDNFNILIEGARPPTESK
jgi:hypothetical protein